MPASVAAAAPCENLSVVFFDNMPARALFVQPTETPQRVSAQMQMSIDGTRSMQSPHWGLGYRVLPSSSDSRNITGEVYWAVGADSPSLESDFQRDSGGRISREILRSPPSRSSAAPESARKILGWYEYVRNDDGRIREIVYHSFAGPDGVWLTDDDIVLSRVVIDYGLDSASPQDAMILYTLGERVAVHFDYDADGRLLGGSRDGAFASVFALTSGPCATVPERLFVLLLGPHGGPWHPINAGRSGARQAGPR
jgi:hypothetical protein